MRNIIEDLISNDRINLYIFLDFSYHKNHKRINIYIFAKKKKEQKISLNIYFVFFRRDLPELVVGVELATAVVGLFIVT